MKLRKLGIFLLLLAMVVSVGGCVFVVAGTIGAVSGYAVTRDTIQGEYDVAYSRAFKSAADVCGILGTVTMRDQAKGTVDALVDHAKVKVEITQLTPQAIRLKVKARKGIFPRMGTAEKVFVKIVQQFTGR